jgi:DnaK suppressor protein
VVFGSRLLEYLAPTLVDTRRRDPLPDKWDQSCAPRHHGEVEGALGRLEVDRDETIGRLASLTADFDAVVAASRDSNADDEHDPEGATIAFERSQIGALVRQTRLRLVEIDAAVKRLDTGTYGRCERCGGAIDEDRLGARPTARTCIQCASAR